ncbi:5'-nucleotidase C-terminal domain-containing protein [Zhihengliuella sp.]|uniref:bifunctional metallophosphatase/5'-nucleotidase n=1 Tax=Zhihengliuella sp. TaxID=1954483 RepID=UPI002811A1ED|nr:5'-nucleotidase C-terminal domain-containing protein [Zhihengliuella sp.]
MTRPDPRRRRPARAAGMVAALSVAGAGLVAGPAHAQPVDADETVTVDLLGINDFHGRLEEDEFSGSVGAAKLAGAVQAFTAENPNTLLVSAGDNIGASTFTSMSQQDNPTIDALSAAGLVASAVGNHEFDRGFADLSGRVQDRYAAATGTDGSAFVLGANVYHAGTTTPALPEYTVREVDGVTVGFVGTVVESVESLVNPELVADLDFGSQLEAADRVAGQLSDGDAANGEADVVVLLTHDGSETGDCDSLTAEGTDYARLVRDASPEIDAIFSGHTHLAYDCEVPVGDTGATRPVLMGADYGKALSRVTLEVDPATGDVVAHDSEIVTLADGGYAADPEVADIVEAADAEAEVIGSEVIGRISGDILRAVDPEDPASEPGDSRGHESSAVNLVADIQLWATSNAAYGGEPAQIAFMNPGGVREDLYVGNDGGVVTFEEAAMVQPFANTLVTMDLTGAQIKAALEEQWQPAGSSRPKLHLGVSEGFEYVYDETRPQGERILEMSFQGEPIADGDVFRVVANSFLAAGGDNFRTFAQGTDRADSGQVDIDATVNYFAAHDVVDPADVGRAVSATAAPSETPAPSEPSAPSESASPSAPGGTAAPTETAEPTEPGTPSETAALPATPTPSPTPSESAAAVPATIPSSSATLEPEVANIVADVERQRERDAGFLARTGVAAAWLGLAGLVLVAGGALLVAARRRPAPRH